MFFIQEESLQAERRIEPLFSKQDTKPATAPGPEVHVRDMARLVRQVTLTAEPGRQGLVGVCVGKLGVAFIPIFLKSFWERLL